MKPKTDTRWGLIDWFLVFAYAAAVAVVVADVYFWRP